MHNLSFTNTVQFKMTNGTKLFWILIPPMLYFLHNCIAWPIYHGRPLLLEDEAPLTNAQMDEVLNFECDDLPNFLESGILPGFKETEGGEFTINHTISSSSSSSSGAQHQIPTSFGQNRYTYPNTDIPITLLGTAIEPPIDLYHHKPSVDNTITKTDDENHGLSGIFSHNSNSHPNHPTSLPPFQAKPQDCGNYPVAISDHERRLETEFSSISTLCGPRPKRLHPDSFRTNQPLNQYNYPFAYPSNVPSLSNPFRPRPKRLRPDSFRPNQPLNQNNYQLAYPLNNPGITRSQNLIEGKNQTPKSWYSSGKSIQEANGRNDSFDVSNVELYKFVWIKTLKMPQRHTHWNRPWDYILELEQEKLDRKKDLTDFRTLWNNLTDKKITEDDLPECLQMVIKYGNISRSEFIRETQYLIEELYLRNKQFITFFTTPGDPKTGDFDFAQERYNDGLRQKEYSNLFRWFKNKLHMTQPIPESGFSSDPNLLKDLILKSFSPFQAMIFSYYHEDTNIKLLGEKTWGCFRESGKDRKPAYLNISGYEVMKTKMAIQILAEYYKSEDREKWDALLEKNDENFLKIFSIMKFFEFHRTTKRFWTFAQKMEKLKILPWKQEPNSKLEFMIEKDLQTYKRILSNKIHQSDWSLIEDKIKLLN